MVEPDSMTVVTDAFVALVVDLVNVAVDQLVFLYLLERKKKEEKKTIRIVHKTFTLIILLRT